MDCGGNIHLSTWLPGGFEQTQKNAITRRFSVSQNFTVDAYLADTHHILRGFDLIYFCLFSRSNVIKSGDCTNGW